MSDALPLPPRPRLDFYRTLARELQHACRSADPVAAAAWSRRWVETLSRLQGLDAASPAVQRAIERESARVARDWAVFQKARPAAGRCSRTEAQFFIARAHGFASWPAFARHVETLSRPGSPVSRFEAAVDAIVAGDAAALRRMLQTHPQLVRARSTREHRSTLLHYVSANGVEDFRQRTPPNIVDLTRLLLEAGADPNATSEAYGGGATTLGLTATSVHPQQAGVQNALLETLLQHGAAMASGADDGSAVTGCLANGRPEAAAFLAERGAALNLAGAAGLGRLDIVAAFFAAGGTLLPTATAAQLASGFIYACGYGHAAVVRWLLERGVDPNLQAAGGETGLHWVSFGPHLEVARLLLDRGARVELRDQRFHGTPLDWALFAWAKAAGTAREGGYELAALLVRAGATVYLPWLEPNAADRVRRDARMLEILRAAIVTSPPGA